MVLDLYLVISGAFAKLLKATVSCVISVCLSVRPLGTRLPLDGFSWNLVCDYFFWNLSRKFKFN